MTINKSTEPNINETPQVQELQLHIQQLERQLAEQKIHETLAHMAGSIAHDISQPLTVMISNLDLLRQRDVVREESARKFFDRIYASAQTIAEITRRVQAIFQTRKGAEEYATSGETRSIRVGILIEDEPLREQVEQLCAEHEHDFTLRRISPSDLDFETLQQVDVDILLIDYNCCPSRLTCLLQNPQLAQLKVPLTFLSDPGGDRAMAGALQVGAMDYLPKSILSRGNLGRMLCYALDRFLLIREMERLQEVVDASRDTTE